MARPKKTNSKKAIAKKPVARGKAKAATKDQMSSNLKTQTATLKMLKGTSVKRPPNNPEVPQDIIDMLNTDLNSIKELLDAFSQHLCLKAKGFSARSLRFAQTPHINSWSFAKGKTPKLKCVAF